MSSQRTLLKIFQARTDAFNRAICIGSSLIAKEGIKSGSAERALILGLDSNPNSTSTCQLFDLGLVT